MIVGKDELVELQGFMQKQIRELETQENADTAMLFDLQAMESNISLLLSCADLQGTEAIELGTRDSQVKEALLNFRNESARKNTEDDYVGEVSFFAAEALSNLLKIKNALPSSEKIFSANINWLLARLVPDVKTLAGLQGNSRLVQKLKVTDVAEVAGGAPAASSSSASSSAASSSTASSSTASSRAAKTVATKTSTAKSSAKTTATKASTVKTAASKTAASKATAKASATKTASAKTTAAKTTKTTKAKAAEAEAPKKRGRPRKSE